MERHSQIWMAAIVCAIVGFQLSDASASEDRSNGRGIVPAPTHARRLFGEQHPDLWAEEGSKLQGYEWLSPRVKANLAQHLPDSIGPISPPNVRANDPAGDSSGFVCDTQAWVSVAAWQQYVVVLWIDTNYTWPIDPVSTEASFGYSCDYGATFTDGGAVPRWNPYDEQLTMGELAVDEHGTFFMSLYLISGLSLGDSEFWTAGSACPSPKPRPSCPSCGYGDTPTLPSELVIACSFRSSSVDAAHPHFHDHCASRKLQLPLPSAIPVRSAGRRSLIG